MPRYHQYSSHSSSATALHSFPPDYSSMSGIQGQLLEVTVVGCNKLKDTEWISRQDPYVCLEYANNKHRTRTCTDGGKHPTFQEKFVIPLIEGLRELNVIVWNSNTVTFDDFIGQGKVQLQKAIAQGYDDSAWPLQTKTGRYAGEVRLIMHYSKTNKPTPSYASSAPPYAAPPQAPMYSTPPPSGHYGPPPAGSYPPPPAGSYPPPPAAYPAPSPYPSYGPSSAGYPPSAYGPPPAAYPPTPYPPTSAYPPSTYPPPPQSSYYPPGPFPGAYPPPPY